MTKQEEQEAWDKFMGEHNKRVAEMWQKAIKAYNEMPNDEKTPVWRPIKEWVVIE